jgi:hypothetical protein
MPRDAWTPDRRRTDRQDVSFPLQARFDDNDALVSVRQLGMGGMIVETPHPLPAGRSVRVTLRTDADTLGPIDGRVAHSRLLLTQRQETVPVYLTGVAFGQVSHEHAAGIRAWLSPPADERLS